MDKLTLRKRITAARRVGKNVPSKGAPKSEEHKLKIALWWTNENRMKQAEVARTVNAEEGLNNYICPDCGKEFEQVKKSVYGGHRRACVHWKNMAAWFEEEEGKTLDELFEP